MIAEAILVDVAALIIAGGVAAVWGVYCYVWGRRSGQLDLIEDLEKNGVVHIDEDGIGRAGPRRRDDSRKTD